MAIADEIWGERPDVNVDTIPTAEWTREIRTLKARSNELAEVERRSALRLEKIDAQARELVALREEIAAHVHTIGKQQAAAADAARAHEALIRRLEDVAGELAGDVSEDWSEEDLVDYVAGQLRVNAAQDGPRSKLLLALEKRERLRVEQIEAAKVFLCEPGDDLKAPLLTIAAEIASRLRRERATAADLSAALNAVCDAVDLPPQSHYREIVEVITARKREIRELVKGGEMLIRAVVDLAFAPEAHREDFMTNVTGRLALDERKGARQQLDRMLAAQDHYTRKAAVADDLAKRAGASKVDADEIWGTVTAIIRERDERIQTLMQQLAEAEACASGELAKILAELEAAGYQGGSIVSRVTRAMDDLRRAKDGAR